MGNVSEVYLSDKSKMLGQQQERAMKKLVNDHSRRLDSIRDLYERQCEGTPKGSPERAFAELLYNASMAGAFTEISILEWWRAEHHGSLFESSLDDVLNGDESPVIEEDHMAINPLSSDGRKQMYAEFMREISEKTYGPAFEAAQYFPSPLSWTENFIRQNPTIEKREKRRLQTKRNIPYHNFFNSCSMVKKDYPALREGFEVWQGARSGERPLEIGDKTIIEQGMFAGYRVQKETESMEVMLHDLHKAVQDTRAAHPTLIDFREAKNTENPNKLYLANTSASAMEFAEGFCQDALASMEKVKRLNKKSLSMLPDAEHQRWASAPQKADLSVLQEQEEPTEALPFTGASDAQKALIAQAALSGHLKPFIEDVSKGSKNTFGSGFENGLQGSAYSTAYMAMCMAIAMHAQLKHNDSLNGLALDENANVQQFVDATVKQGERLGDAVAWGVQLSQERGDPLANSYQLLAPLWKDFASREMRERCKEEMAKNRPFHDMRGLIRAGDACVRYQGDIQRGLEKIAHQRAAGKSTMIAQVTLDGNGNNLATKLADLSDDGRVTMSDITQVIKAVKAINAEATCYCPETRAMLALAQSHAAIAEKALQTARKEWSGFNAAMHETLSQADAVLKEESTRGHKGGRGQ